MSDFEWSCCDFTSPSDGSGTNQQMLYVDGSGTVGYDDVSIMISNAYFCQANNPTSPSPMFVLTGANKILISNCEFAWNGATPSPLIHLKNGCKNVKFDGSIFDGSPTYPAITIDSGCSNNSILGCFLNGATISDSGTSTIIALNQP